MSTILILGATSDIGIAIARKFAQAGYAIQLAGRDLSSMMATASDLSIRHNATVNVHEFDASRPEMHELFFAALNPKPEIVVYSVGYMGNDETALKPWKETKEIINANYLGAVSMLNIAARYYSDQEKGTIVGISSVAGERGRQSNLIYGSAKAAFTAYLSGLRNYLYSYHVQVITIKPGFVHTKMTSHLNLPGILTATSMGVADCVYHAVKKKKNVVYVKGIWRLIMTIIKSIPESIFKKMKL